MTPNAYYPSLLSEEKAKDTKRKIVSMTRKIKEIKRFLLNSNSPLSLGLSHITELFHSTLEDNLFHYKIITLEQMFYGLAKTSRGVLCIRVFQELQKIENKTPLVTIMKGLLTPKEHRDVEETALEKADEELKCFLKDVDFLSTAIKRGRIPTSIVKKYDGVTMNVIKDNLGEFQSAKERLEEVQDKRCGDVEEES